MRIGLIGAGNMATALARGLSVPVLVADVDHGRAAALAGEMGGEALASNAEVAARADVIILCHKPAQLEQVAKEIRGSAKSVVSILGSISVAALEAAYPGLPVYRFMPNVAAELGSGVLCYAPGEHAAVGPEQAVLDLFSRAGSIFRLPEQLIETATALIGCGPAFFALVVEALADAGVAHGLTPDQAALMTVETMAGTAELLREHPTETAQLRRRVTSPGGSTARGLAALERAGVRSAFGDAVDAVVRVGPR